MKQLRVTVDGKAYNVSVEVLSDDSSSSRPAAAAPVAASASVSAPAAAAPAAKPAAPAGDGAVVSPMAAKIIAVKVKDGDSVKAGQEVIILEAMKMETPVTASADGVVKGLSIAAGDTVEEGQVLFTLGG